LICLKQINSATHSDDAKDNQQHCPNKQVLAH
jgi:hypothetical protein